MTVSLRRAVLGAAAMGLVSASNFAPTACADWNSFWRKVHVGTHRNIAWPDPFNEADALEVVSPFETMKQNGWQRHNTIGHELFRAGDGALLASGQNRVHWIATQAPQDHREIYVLQAATEKETQARIAAVKEAVAGLQINGVEPRILVTHVVPNTAPGALAVKINRDRLEHSVPPKLPTTTAAGTAGVSE